MELCFTIKDLGLKGKGVVTTKPLSEGGVIFEETPIVCCQFSWNSEYGYKACDHCMRPLETTIVNARRLTGVHDLQLPYPECCPTKVEDHTFCPSCNVLYCSEKCRIIALQQYHSSLCDSEKDSPLKQLNETWKQLNYPPETATIMLLARIFAVVEQAEDKQAAMNVFREFSHSEISKDSNIAAQQLMGVFLDQIELLRDMFIKAVPSTSVTQEWLTLDGFTSLLALVGANGQGVGSSVFSNWVSNVEKLTLTSDEKQAVDDIISTIYEKMDSHVGLAFLNNEGSALYSTQKYINHSCDPNAEITFPHSNSTLRLVALRNIEENEEICISYLDDCLLDRSRHTRQKLLREKYFFSCTCSKCILQANDIDETSSEDEDEEMEEDD